MPMVEATTKAAAVAAIPITKTTSTIITKLSAVGTNGQNKRTIIIYPTGKFLYVCVVNSLESHFTDNSLFRTIFRMFICTRTYRKRESLL